MLTIYDTDEWRGFASAIRDAPGDELPRLIAADWLRERGEAEHKIGELEEPLLVTKFGIGSGRGGIGSSGIGVGRGIGVGIGRGSGIGSGIGIGSGGSGVGSGRGGIGVGSGRGIGRGIGSGIGIGGIGVGSGIGSGSGRQHTKETIMEPGKRYLMFVVDWYAWCFRMVRQVGPYEYECDLVSKFDTNQGDVFGEVAANEPGFRNRCTFQHFKGKALLGHGRTGIFEWVGKLPQEA